MLKDLKQHTFLISYFLWVGGAGLAQLGTVHGCSQDAGGAAVSSETGLGRGPLPTWRFSARGPLGAAWLRARFLLAPVLCPGALSKQ